MNRTQKIIFLPVLTIFFAFSFVCGLLINIVSLKSTQTNSVSFDEFSSNVVKLTEKDDESVFDENNTNPYKTKRLIVKCFEQLDGYGAIDVAEGYNGLHVYSYATVQDTINAYNHFNKLKQVEWCCPDGVSSAAEVEEGLHALGYGDSFSYKSWGAASIGAETYSKYLINTIGKNNLKEVIVAVLDTGIDTDHPWFSNRIAQGGRAFISSTSAGAAYEDDQGHGTHVSGIICDISLSNVKILPIKVLNNKGQGANSVIISGINYVTNLKRSGVNIVAINLSLGGPDTYLTQKPFFTEALQSAYNAGIMPVVAAGNENTYAEYVTPANVECALTVAAVGKSGNRYFSPYYSNYGDIVDISAPGDVINSAQNGGGTVSLSGTSMATPHVAAAVAMLCSDSTHNYNNGQIESTLKNSVIDLGTPGKDAFYGYGMLNLVGIDESLPGGNDEYIVRHWQQALNPFGAVYHDGKYYQIKDSQVLRGNIGETTNASPKNYEGFNSLPFEQKTIFSDGSTTIDIFYDRKSYTLTLIDNVGIKRLTGAGTWYYGQEVELEAVLEEGYEFVCWTGEGVDIEDAIVTIIMPSKNITLEAIATEIKFKINLNFSGSVGAYVSNIDSSGAIRMMWGDDYYPYYVVDYNSDFTFYFKHPNNYNDEYNLIVDGVNVGKVKEYTFHNIKEDHTLSVQIIGKAVVSSSFLSGPMVIMVPISVFAIIVGIILHIVTTKRKKRLAKMQTSTVETTTKAGASSTTQQTQKVKEDKTNNISARSKDIEKRLAKLDKMKKSGIITDEEYQVLKNELLDED